MKQVGAMVLSFFGLSTGLLALDWPQWRGPDRTGVSMETGLLKSWPQEGPKQVWLHTQAGLGYAGFSVVGGKLFTLGTRDDREIVLCLDAATGKELWTQLGGLILENNWGNGPRGTPTVDGDRVYALGGRGTLVCLQAADGKEVWRVKLEDLGGKIPDWGYTESVLVDGEHVICTPGGSKGTVAALDKTTGKTRWQSKEITDGAQYPSTIVFDHNGARQYVQLTMKHLVGVAAKDGKVLWQADWPGQTAVIPTPIFAEGRVYATAGYGVGSLLVKLEEGHKATQVYFNKVMKNHHGGVIKVGDFVYGHSDPNGWTCQDFLTGGARWVEKSKLGKGAIACAGERLYLLGERDGTVALIEASPEAWKEHGRFKIAPLSKVRSDRGGIWTHPVIANGRLYLRDQDHIYCYDIKE